MSLTVMALPLQDCSADEASLAIGAFIIERYVFQSIMMNSYEKSHVHFPKVQSSII